MLRRSELSTGDIHRLKFELGLSEGSCLVPIAYPPLCATDSTAERVVGAATLEANHCVERYKFERRGLVAFAGRCCFLPLGLAAICDREFCLNVHSRQSGR